MTIFRATFWVSVLVHAPENHTFGCRRIHSVSFLSSVLALAATAA